KSADENTARDFIRGGAVQCVGGHLGLTGYRSVEQVDRVRADPELVAGVVDGIEESAARKPHRVRHPAAAGQDGRIAAPRHPCGPLCCVAEIAAAAAVPARAGRVGWLDTRD